MTSFEIAFAVFFLWAFTCFCAYMLGEANGYARRKRYYMDYFGRYHRRNKF